MYNPVQSNYVDLLGPVKDAAGVLSYRSETNNDVAVAAAVSNVLQHMRERLMMDVAFVAAFEGTMRRFLHVESDTHFHPIRRGDRMPLSVGYCKKVVDGILPQLVRDTSSVPLLRSIPETRRTPVGSYISIPLMLSRTQLYGTLCCFSRSPHPSLDRQDHGWVDEIAGLVGTWIAAGRRFADPLGWTAWPAFDGQGAGVPGACAGGLE